MSTPLDVIAAALAVPVPCPVCGLAETCDCTPPDGYTALGERARLIEAALIDHGHLAHEHAPPTEAETHELAKWLAEQSRHPRYVLDDDGWERLLDSEVDVDVAYTAARRHNPTQQAQEQLAVARAHLTALVASRRASETAAS